MKSLAGPCYSPLGLEDGSILDNQLSSSSQSSDSTTDCHERNGRLNHPRGDTSKEEGGWCPQINSQDTISEAYMQIDLENVLIVEGVITQGGDFISRAQWVTEYQVQYSNEQPVNRQTVWIDVTDSNGNIEVKCMLS